jgi:Fe-S-cluster containining protein
MIKLEQGTSPPDCSKCGACCAYSFDWPEFVADDDGDKIPERLIAEGGGCMRCDGDRCSALVGEVGKQVSCAVYADRPSPCREFSPGGAGCRQVRRFFKLDEADPEAGGKSGAEAGAGLRGWLPSS